MAFFKPRPVGDFLRRRKLIQLRREAEAQTALLEKVQALLPWPLGVHCVAARLHENGLILHADSSVWASRLRYAGPELVNGLMRKGIRADSVRVRIVPAALPPKAPRKREASPLSPANAELLRQMADEVGDLALGAALRRLSKHRRF